MTPSEILRQHPVHGTPVGDARVAHREAGDATAPTHVLLHGIGSASGSWAFQLAAAHGRPDLRVLAGDAPGAAGRRVQRRWRRASGPPA